MGWSFRIRWIVPRPRWMQRLLNAPSILVYPQLGFSVAIRTTSCSMSAWVRGRLGRRRAGKVHFRATRTRCQRSRAAGVTMGSRSRSALRPSPFARVAKVRRSASVKMIRRPESRLRRARCLCLQVFDPSGGLSFQPGGNASGEKRNGIIDRESHRIMLAASPPKWQSEFSNITADGVFAEGRRNRFLPVTGGLRPGAWVTGSLRRRLPLHRN